MARFLTKKPGLSLLVMCLWGFYFLFSPFLHYHPSDVHAHADELQPHHHEGHYHSEELEALAHAWNFHPADKQQDQKRHHSHSSPEHDSDQSEVGLEKAGLQVKKFNQSPKLKGNLSSRFIVKSPSLRIKAILPVRFHAANGPDPFRGRSPPYFLA